MNLNLVNVSSEESIARGVTGGGLKLAGLTDSKGSGEYFSSMVLQQAGFLYEKIL